MSLASMVMSPICTFIACVRFLYLWMSIFLMDDAVSISGSVWHVLSMVLSGWWLVLCRCRAGV